MGFNGNIAVAMVVVNGGEGAPTYGPRVAKFLDLVNSRGLPAGQVRAFGPPLAWHAVWRLTPGGMIG